MKTYRFLLIRAKNIKQDICNKANPKNNRGLIFKNTKKNIKCLNITHF